MDGDKYNEEGYLDIHWLTEEVEKKYEEIYPEEEEIQIKKIILIFLSILQEVYEGNPVDVNELFYTDYYLNLCNKYKE